MYSPIFVPLSLSCRKWRYSENWIFSSLNWTKHRTELRKGREEFIHFLQDARKNKSRIEPTPLRHFVTFYQLMTLSMFANRRSFRITERRRSKHTPRYRERIKNMERLRISIGIYTLEVSMFAISMLLIRHLHRFKRNSAQTRAKEGRRSFMSSFLPVGARTEKRREVSQRLHI